MTTDLERFDACMEYRPCDRRPNHELGVWPQTIVRWRRERWWRVRKFTWEWHFGEARLGFDRRDYFPFDFSFRPPFEFETIDATGGYFVMRNHLGIVTKRPMRDDKNGLEFLMEQHLSFPVSKPEDFADIRRRLDPATPGRYPEDLAARAEALRKRDCPVFCAVSGFYWRAREWMGTEGLSMAFYEYPALIEEMMEFYADFIIETARPVVGQVPLDGLLLSEDFAMKGGPLLSPDLFRTYVFPHLKRVADFFRGHGVKHIGVDSDGDPTLLIPLLLDAGVDFIWPIERAAGVSPQQWRKQFGRDLRMYGGVDKRILPLGKKAVRQHLSEFIPLIEEGGYIPAIDHTVPPNIAWSEFKHYLDDKQYLLTGAFEKLR